MSSTGLREARSPERVAVLVSDRGEERKTSVPRPPQVRRPGQLDAGPFEADVASFRLRLAAENKAAGTIRIYTQAARWFTASHLLAETDKTRWDQVDAPDVWRWVVWLLGRYSEAYAYQQYRSLEQFFRWLAVEEDLPSPMAKLRPPKVTDKPVPFFSSVELSKLGRCCRGNPSEDRRDAAVLAVLLATGIRASELAAIRYCRYNPSRGDVDLEAREIRVRGKGGRERTVRIGHEAARRVDRYLRVRSRHELAYRPELWLGAGRRGPLDRSSGIYPLVVAGRRVWGDLVPAPVPASFQSYLAGAGRCGG
jgi:site-specific recombinase XerD